jgi:hypothetical protein
MAKTRTIITVQPTKKNMLFGYNYKKYVWLPWSYVY